MFAFAVHAEQGSVGEITFGSLRSVLGIFIVQARQELGDRAGLTLRRRPVDLIGCLAAISAGVGLYDAGINRKTFALDQASLHAGPHHCLEHVAQDVAVAEAAVAIDRERRVVRHFVIKMEAAKPAISEMQLDLLAKPPLEADAVAIAHNQHPDHELGIDRRPANVAIKGRQLPAQPVSRPD